jgi:hydrogenase maturation protein HypF
MRKKGKISVRGIVQGVGFRPFVFACAQAYEIKGTVKNLGSEVEIIAFGDRFDEFVAALSRGTPLSQIDGITITDVDDTGPPEGFRILESGTGSLSGFIPADVAICDACLEDIFTSGGRYENYWATSCVNCGPRYSIIGILPYDRERTSMAAFPLCDACAFEFGYPGSRRHHAQTIACERCGPALILLDSSGTTVSDIEPIRETARLLNAGAIIAIRGIGGFHVACIEESAGRLKEQLGRTEQPLAVMMKPEIIDEIVEISPEDREMLIGPERPIVVLPKRDPTAHASISNLHTIGCMLPYTGLHALLFSQLKHPFLVMTSANAPGYPMVTGIDHAMALLGHAADYFLTHDRLILNRCDDSVVRDGNIIRLSRGYAPKRTALDLGRACILGVGPELNANISIYREGFCFTSPHVGNVRNPSTLAYLEETVEKIGSLIDARYDIIAHDLHPQFLSTRFAAALARETDAELIAVQHHRAHIAAATQDPCIGIAIDGVGYGDDATIWGGEVFAGAAPDYDRVGHLEVIPMPGGDLATRFPERMLYGMLPGDEVCELLLARGWTDIEVGVLGRQLERGINVPLTSSTGRVLDAVSALLGICRERTYDGEPAMKLESAAIHGKKAPWDLRFDRAGGCEVLSTRDLVRHAWERMQGGAVADIAASFQYNLARGIAHMAINAAQERDIPLVALSGGVTYNRAIRETIQSEVHTAGLELVMNREFPLGDGCISFGQCVCAGTIKK